MPPNTEISRDLEMHIRPAIRYATHGLVRDSFPVSRVAQHSLAFV